MGGGWLGDAAGQSGWSVGVSSRAAENQDLDRRAQLGASRRLVVQSCVTLWQPTATCLEHGIERQCSLPGLDVGEFNDGVCACLPACLLSTRRQLFSSLARRWRCIASTKLSTCRRQPLTKARFIPSVDFNGPVGKPETGNASVGPTLPRPCRLSLWFGGVHFITAQ